MKKALLLLLMLCLMPLSSALALEKTDIVFTFDEQVYIPGDEPTALLRALEAHFGKGKETQTASCLFTGMDKEFDFGDIIVGTYPMGKNGADVIESIIVFQGEWPTVRGIAIGATLEDVEKAYGNDYTLAYDQLTYCLGDPLTDPALTFFLDLETKTVLGYFLMGNGG